MTEIEAAKSGRTRWAATYLAASTGIAIPAAIASLALGPELRDLAGAIARPWTSAACLAAAFLAALACVAALDRPVGRATGYEAGMGPAKTGTMLRVAAYTILFGAFASAVADLALWLWPLLPERGVKAARIGLSGAMGIMLYQTLVARQSRSKAR